jgi:deoxyadenosine/deoxycytidine kinase
MKRIATRGRSFESGYTLEYLQSITDRLTEYATSLTTLKDIVYLPFDTEQFDLGMPANQQKLLSLLKPTLN